VRFQFRLWLRAKLNTCACKRDRDRNPSRFLRHCATNLQESTLSMIPLFSSVQGSLP
jgi:hypothetical protein